MHDILEMRNEGVVLKNENGDYEIWTTYYGDKVPMSLNDLDAKLDETLASFVGLTKARLFLLEGREK